MAARAEAEAKEESVHVEETEEEERDEEVVVASAVVPVVDLSWVPGDSTIADRCRDLIRHTLLDLFLIPTGMTRDVLQVDLGLPTHASRHTYVFVLSWHVATRMTRLRTKIVVPEDEESRRDWSTCHSHGHSHRLTHGGSHATLSRSRHRSHNRSPRPAPS